MTTVIKILVIDDNPMIRELLGRGLESFGEIQLAADGAEALEQLETAKPELVIVDAELGAKGEPSLLEQLRGRHTARMILLSARDSGDESHRPFDDSVDEIVEKPFLIRDLQSRVRRHRGAHQPGAHDPLGGRRLRPWDAGPDERHRPGAVARDGPQELLPLTDGRGGGQPENRAEIRGSIALRNVFRRRATDPCRQRLGAGR